MRSVFIALMMFLFSSAHAAAFDMEATMKLMRNNLKCISSGGMFCKPANQEVALFQQNLIACEQNIEAYFADLVQKGTIPRMPAMDQVHQAFKSLIQESQNLGLAVQNGNDADRKTSLRNIKMIMENAHDSFRPE